MADSTWQCNCSLSSSFTPTLKVCHASAPSTSARVCLRSHRSAPLTLLQVVGGPARTRELSPDGISALWPHLHGLPRPAADEAAHGPVSEEVQVSPFWIQTRLLGSFTHIDVLRLCFESPVWVTSSLSDEMLHYWLIGWLQSQACKFSPHQQNSPLGGGFNLASFHSDQSGALTMPHVGWLSAQNDCGNSCTLVQCNNWWSSDATSSGSLLFLLVSKLFLHLQVLESWE